jgi:hypothetical protein
MIYDEMIEKYGEEKVIFSSYYKYSFSFRNDKGITVHFGGDSDTIYKFEVEAGKEYKISELEPDSVYVNGEIVYQGLYY